MQAALGCFEKNGFHKSSMQEICKAAALSPGTVYHYFSSKEDIIVHIAEREVGRSQEFADYLATCPSLEKGLGVVVDLILGSEEYGDFQVYLEVMCEAGRSHPVAELLRKADDIALTAINKKLKAEGKGGEEASRQALAVYIGGQLEFLEMYKRLKPSARDAGEVGKVCKRALGAILSQASRQ